MYQNPSKNINTINPNLFQFEIIDGGDINKGPALSFWTQSKPFDWDFDKRTTGLDLIDERKDFRRSFVTDNQRPDWKNERIIKIQEDSFNPK